MVGRICGNLDGKVSRLDRRGGCEDLRRVRWSECSQLLRVLGALDRGEGLGRVDYRWGGMIGKGLAALEGHSKVEQETGQAGKGMHRVARRYPKALALFVVALCSCHGPQATRSEHGILDIHFA